MTEVSRPFFHQLLNYDYKNQPVETVQHHIQTQYAVYSRSIGTMQCNTLPNHLCHGNVEVFSKYFRYLNFWSYIVADMQLHTHTRIACVRYARFCRPARLPAIFIMITFHIMTLFVDARSRCRNIHRVRGHTLSIIFDVCLCSDAFPTGVLLDRCLYEHVCYLC